MKATTERRLCEKLPVSGRVFYLEKNCYKVQYDNVYYYVKLFKFQEKEDTPSEIPCIVKTIGGKTTVSQDFAPMLKELYKIGEVYDFRVRTDFSAHGYYEVIDEYGFFFRLTDYGDSRLYIHQHIRCKVAGLNGIKITLELVSRGADDDNATKTLTQEEVARLIREDLGHEVPWNVEDMARLMFLNKDHYVLHCSHWIRQTIEKHLNGLSEEDFRNNLEEMKDSVLFLLESSDTLNNCDDQERHIFQQRLSALAEQLELFITASEKIIRGEHEEYINQLLANLKTSGYIYHPKENMELMMCIFILKKGLMENMMQQIFSIVHGREADYWRNDPFRRPFIRLLELYVTENRAKVDAAANSDSKEVRRIIEALAIQLYLAEEGTDDDLCDWAMNKAVLYRYASYLKTSQPKVLLEKAFMSLMDTSMERKDYKWEDTRWLDLLASKLSAPIPNDARQAIQKTYKGNSAQLEITDESITLLPTHPEPETKEALPASLLPWHNMQVRLAKPPRPFSKKKRVDLKTYLTMWAEIERSLFESKKPQKQNTVKHTPGIGQEMNIRILYKDPKDARRYRCRIEDGYYSGEGYIACTDIVGYDTHSDTEAFISENGLPLLFRATVTGHNSAGNICHFTMRRQVLEHIRMEMVSYTTESKCLVTFNDGTNIVGITEDGVPVMVSNSDEFSDCLPGDYLLVSHFEANKNSNMIVEAIDDIEADFTVDKCFKALMCSYAKEEYHDPKAEDNVDVQEFDTILDASRVKELINIIDRHAVMEADYTIRYNYLCMARLVSRMLEDDKRCLYYSGWMKLIQILDNFAINGAVNIKELEESEQAFNDLFSEYTENSHLFIQLKVLGCKGREDKQEQLFYYVNEFNNTEIGALASLILSYNLLEKVGCERGRAEIDESISEILHVQNQDIRLKDFGEEDLHTEFKTSIVYPPENHMQPDLKRQTLEIMKGICAFLNTEGGTLYLGVNNYGVGVGIENDLSYREFAGSKDKFDLYVHAQIRQVFGSVGRDVEAYVKTEFQIHAGRLIYAIHMEKPYPTALEVEGVIYERHGSSKIAMLEENAVLFKERRLKEMAEKDAPTPPKETIPTAPELPAIGEEERIATGSLRNNVLLDYEEGYETATRYLQFLPDHTYQCTDCYYGEPTLLTLNIHEEERESFIVIAYESGNVFRLPVSNIIDKGTFNQYKLNNNDRIVFASVASCDDALLTVSEDKKGRRIARLDNIDEVELAKNMQVNGSRMFDVEVERFVMFDVIPQKLKTNFTKLQNAKRKSVGVVLTGEFGDKLASQLLNLGIRLK